MKKLTLLLVLMVTAWAAPAFAGKVVVTVINVGYGESILLRSPESPERWSALIDAGLPESISWVQSTLARLGVHEIEIAFLTHPHPNHAGGYRVWAHPPIRTFFWSGDTAGEKDIAATLKNLEKRGTNIRIVRKGFRIQGPDEIDLEVLNPERLAMPIHHNCLVILMTYGKTAMLFGGDIDPALQGAIMQSVQDRIKEEGLELCFASWPHHGGTLDPAWAEGFKEAKWLGVSIGANLDELPKVDQYPDLTSKVLRTDRIGTFSIISDGTTCSLDAR